MPNITKRRVFKIGASYAITLPKPWIEWANRKIKEKFGKKIEDVELEIETSDEVVIRLPKAEE